MASACKHYFEEEFAKTLPLRVDMTHLPANQQARLFCPRVVALVIAIFVVAGVEFAIPCAAQTTRASGGFASGNFDSADALINAAIAEGKCPGAVLLLGRRDAVVYKKAYGNRSLRPTTQPMTTDTVFDLASLTKPVATATSVMILSQRGKLKLDDPVSKFMPGFGQSGKEKISVADLLLHVAGLIPDNDLSDYADGPDKAFARIFAAPPAYPARSRFAYSDVGYIVLGELVHHVDGRSLDVFSHEEIFRPLGMNDTGFSPPGSLKPRCAPTGQRDGHWLIGEVHDPRAHALGNVSGHAGLFSTADDLAIFCRMLLSGARISRPAPLLGKSTLDQMLAGHSVPLFPTGCGIRAYGFDIDTPYSSPRGERFEPGTTFGHTGFTGTAFWIDPAHQCYYILLTNSVHPDGKGSVKQLRHDVATAVAKALLDEK